MAIFKLPLRQSLLGLAFSAVIPLGGYALEVDVLLTERPSAQPVTTNSIPHAQINVVANPEFSSELIRRIDALEGVYVQPTSNSLAGAKGFRLNDNVTPARPQSLLGGREFAHLHADGSLHAFLDPRLAEQAVASKWGTYHPWARQNPGWDGFVMIYTPTTADELEIVINLVQHSYHFVVGEKT
ncbi:MAG: luciferase family protein [Hellea sp.]